jgi:hypothetical protein
MISTKQMLINEAIHAHFGNKYKPLMRMKNFSWDLLKLPMEPFDPSTFKMDKPIDLDYLRNTDINWDFSNMGK